MVANDLTIRVPGGTSKGHRTWEEAVEHYTRIYNRGGIKVEYPRTPTSTPGRSASTPFVIDSAAPTPSPGAHIRPIAVNSSPAATPGYTAAMRPVIVTPGARLAPILVSSSPVTTPVHRSVRATEDSTPSTPTRSTRSAQETAKLHNYIDRKFAEIHAARAATAAAVQSSPSMSQHVVSDSSTIRNKDAAWIDPTPVSIPRARIFHSTGSQDGCELVTQDGHDPVSQDGRDPDSESDSTGAHDEYFDADSDDEYFINFRMTPQDLAALAEMDEVLAEPRFA